MPQKSATAIRIHKGPDYISLMDVFVTNQCNLGCVSCCVDTVKKPGGAVHLKWADFKAAIDVFMDPEQLPYGERKEIAIAGGEPFLLYPLLLSTAKYIQRFKDQLHVYIHTNGTLVKPEQIRELRRYGLGIIFSIDGSRDAHDRYRPYANGAKRSAFDTVMNKIRDIPKEGLGTNTVLRPDALTKMVETLDGFSRMGFKSCDLWIDYLREWSPTDLSALKEFMDEFGDYYAKRTEAGGRIPFYVGALQHALFSAGSVNLKRVWWKKCFRLTLGADGNFYDCEAIGCFPYEKGKEHIIHHARDGKGVDWAARESYLDEANDRLEQLGADKEVHHICPRLYYTIAKIRGADPAPLIENLHRVSRVFYAGFVRLSGRLRAHPDFKKTYLESEGRDSG